MDVTDDVAPVCTENPPVREVAFKGAWHG